MEQKRTGLFLTKEERDSLNLIQNHMACAQQALDPRNIPADCTDEQAVKFVKAAMQAKAESLFMEQDWWRSVVEKYKLRGKHIHIDFENNELLDVVECEHHK